LEPRVKEDIVFDLWGDEGLSEVAGPPRETLPGHEESYNPPSEYGAEHPGCFRKLPGYELSIEDRYSRCLDLLLCPRIVKERLNINPESLIPQLPDIETLKPFPTDLKLKYKCKTRVLSIAWSPNGELLATGEKGGTVTIWEADTGKALETVKHSGPISCVAFNPVRPVLAYACEKSIYIYSPKHLHAPENYFAPIGVAP
jgi:ribosome biogenesis protein ERB1